MQHRVAAAFLIPPGKADMGRQLHSGPFSLPEGGEFLRQLQIPPDAVLRQGGVSVGDYLALGGVVVVFPGVQVHFQKIHGSHGGEMNHAVIGVPFPGA